MNDHLFYLLEVSLCFAVLYGVFYCFFRQLTFHKLNRIVLLCFIPISLFLPMLEFDTPHYAAVEQALNISIPTVKRLAPFETELPQVTNTKESFNWIALLLIVYGVGFTVQVFRFVMGLMAILKLKKQSISVPGDQYELILGNYTSIFSCFHWIFIPKQKQYTYDLAILKHEIAHVNLKHTYDLILTEVYLALFWFNPMVYQFKRSLKAIHEFQADQSAIGNQIKKSTYLEILLQDFKVSSSPNFLSFFNYPIIKKRIEMITKENSKKHALLRYGLILPVLAGLMLACTLPETKVELPTVQVVQATEVVKPEVVIEDGPPSIFPVKDYSKNSIYALFGKGKIHPITKKKRFHHGIDIKAPEGTPVVATANGVIQSALNEENWGNRVIIKHADGYDTRYSHLQSFKVTKGQKVKKGEIIAFLGNTGLSIGPHLHYEVRKDGKLQDPINFIENRN